MLDSSQRKDTSNHNITAEQPLISSVVLNSCEQLRQYLPHLEVQVPTMDDLSFRCSDQKTRACCKGRVFIHEIYEEDLVEGQVAEGGNCIDFLHEILMDELVLSVPLYSVVESLRDGKDLQELNESAQSLVEGLDDGCPPGFGIFIDLHLESQRNMGLDRSNMRHNRSLRDHYQNHSNKPRIH